ncbi:hypothetical protein ONS96_006740 [Cadophora gregata f. sp. sojae]|nr:hypothetical protein ONS96_006740 [Cadophora gregata f. sp. sojae]
MAKSKDNSAGNNEPTPTSSRKSKIDELILVYEAYYKLFEWKRKSEIDKRRSNGETIPQFSINPYSSTVWITVSWCLQNTYDDDGYNDGDCEEEDPEAEEIKLPASVFEGGVMRREDLKVLYVWKGY